MLKILMGPNVKIHMGQVFGSWTHGHGSMALGAWAAARAMDPCPCVQEANRFFRIPFFSIPGFLAYRIF